MTRKRGMRKNIMEIRIVQEDLYNYRLARASLFTILKTRLRASSKMYFRRSRPVIGAWTLKLIYLKAVEQRESVMKRG